MRSPLFPLLFLLLGACVSPPLLQEVPLSPAVTLTLPPADTLGRRVEATQLVTLHYQDEAFTFEGRLSATPEAFVLVGTDSLGRRALRLRWSAAGLETERASWLPDSLRAENILADIMLLYWPEEVLRPRLAGAVLERSPTGRKVLREGTEIMRIRYPGPPWQGPPWQGPPWSGVAQLENMTWGYTLDVRSALVSP